MSKVLSAEPGTPGHTWAHLGTPELEGTCHSRWKRRGVRGSQPSASFPRACWEVHPPALLSHLQCLPWDSLKAPAFSGFILFKVIGSSLLPSSSSRSWEIMPACISRGEKKQIVRRCQESGLNAFTDWEGTERSCSRSGLQLPRDSPTASFPADPSAHPLQETTSPTRHRTSFKEERKLRGLGGTGDPWEPSPSTHMQSSKHLLLRPRLWGVQRCSRRSQHVPADTAHTRGQPSCVDPPRRPRHSPK